MRARIFFDDCVLLHSNPNIDFRNISMACLQRCAVVLDILTVVVTSAQEMKGCEGPPFKKFHSPPSSLPRKSTSPLATSHPTEQRLLNDQCRHNTPPKPFPYRLLPLARTCYEVGDHTKTVRVVREFAGRMEDSRWMDHGRS